MHTLIIAHRDPAVAASFEADFQKAGYHVITCPGPFPPQLRCIQYDTNYCPLTDAADALIYDPTLVALDAGGKLQNLALESARAHPDLAVLVTALTEAEAATDVMTHARNIVLAAQDRSEMLVQIKRLTANTVEMLRHG